MTTYQSNLHLKQALAEAAQIARRQALAHLVQELMEVLIQQGYQFDDLVEALADYADQKPNLAEATKHLEEAAEEIVRVQAQLANISRSDRAAR